MSVSANSRSTDRVYSLFFAAELLVKMGDGKIQTHKRGDVTKAAVRAIGHDAKVIVTAVVATCAQSGSSGSR